MKLLQQKDENIVYILRELANQMANDDMHRENLLRGCSSEQDGEGEQQTLKLTVHMQFHATTLYRPQGKIRHYNSVSNDI